MTLPIGTYARVALRPVEWRCPNCDKFLHVNAGHDGVVVRVVPPPADMEIAHVRGCNCDIPLPGGWNCFQHVGNVDRTVYALPYTLLEPLEGAYLERVRRYPRTSGWAPDEHPTTAMRESACATCGGPIAVQDPIVWDSRALRASHRACAEGSFPDEPIIR